MREKLSPSERAAYMLRRRFDDPYERIAEIVHRSHHCVRHHVSRARKRLSEEKWTAVGPGEHRQLLDAFVASAHQGNFTALEHLLLLMSNIGPAEMPATVSAGTTKSVWLKLPARSRAPISSDSQRNTVVLGRIRNGPTNYEIDNRSTSLLGVHACGALGRARERSSMSLQQQQPFTNRFIGTLDGLGSADHDKRYSFGRRPCTAAPFLFSTHQYAHLLSLTSRLADYIATREQSTNNETVGTHREPGRRIPPPSGGRSSASMSKRSHARYNSLLSARIRLTVV
jgi:hypothetical protein